MVRGGAKREMHEIAETRGSARDDKFEAILTRLATTPGAEITKDEVSPHYVDIGMDEFELGEKREVEFSLANGIEFQLVRLKDTHSIQGEGKQKHAEPLTTPRIKLSLKQRPKSSDQWQVVDLEDMF